MGTGGYDRAKVRTFAMLAGFLPALCGTALAQTPEPTGTPSTKPKPVLRQMLTTPPGGGAAALSLEADALIVIARDGTRHRLTLADSRIRFAPAPRAAQPATSADALPGAAVASGPGVAAAWLAEPTGVYRHGVFGSAVEARAAAMRLAGGAELRLRLDENSVFEDRRPRLVSLDAEGRTLLLLVRANAATGAALVLLGVVDGALRTVAQSEPAGPQRWLNPVGVADFDGDGEPEIAAVVTPHIGGTLKLFRRENEKLVEVLAAPGFSNHVFGAGLVPLDAIADLDGDGVSDLALPDASRRSLVLLTLKGRTYHEFARLPAYPALAGLAAADLEGDGKPELAAVLTDGALMVLKVVAP